MKKIVFIIAVLLVSGCASIKSAKMFPGDPVTINEQALYPAVKVEF